MDDAGVGTRWLAKARESDRIAGPAHCLCRALHEATAPQQSSIIIRYLGEN